MHGDSQHGMQCPECEALLAEALDGTLHGSTLAAFEAHQQSCSACRTLVEESRMGMHLLKGLDEVESPGNLVHNILAQTIGALPSEHIAARPTETWTDRIKARIAGFFGPVATPRFAMSFGMAFFSITMLLGVAGFHMSDIRRWDLSAKGVTKTYYDAQARVVRYYENIRLVYEIESRVRDLRRAATPDKTQQEENNTPSNKPSTKPKDQTQQQKYQRGSHEDGQPALAATPAAGRTTTQARLNRSES